MLPNFNLNTSGKLSEKLIKKGIKTYHQAVRYIQQLPYGRPAINENYWTVISEGQGTCSSKHAYLKALAEENMIHSIELRMGIYAMNEENTPGVGPVLETYQLEYIIEAHTYLSYDGERFDFTFPGRDKKLWEDAILVETEIDADQIGEYKIEYHKSVLEDWKKRNKIPYSVDALWNIREQCIDALRKNRLTLTNDTV